MQIRSNPARWQRLKEILADALEQTSIEGRTAVLRESCADDTALFHEAERLLAKDTSVFEEFAGLAAIRLRQQERHRIGDRIGAYAVVSELGRGGMGAVYLAERADGQFEKRVAIKVPSEARIPTKCCAVFESSGRFWPILSIQTLPGF